jgi:23S rRNA pseudouridine1911/1915/1917 synthase
MSHPSSYKILFEDTHLIVLSKEAGLLSQSDISDEDSLVDLLRIYLGRNYVGLIHRLDRNTSGLMVVAKRTKAARRLTESLQAGHLKRTYLAIVEGNPPSHAKLKNYLLKNEATNEVKVVDAKKSGAKLAELEFQRLLKFEFQKKPLSLIHLQLLSGRSHQIRVQCSHEGYPLVGDKKYQSQLNFLNRPALHSYSLEFPHPMTHELMKFNNPLPLDLAALIPQDEKIIWP